MFCLIQSSALRSSLAGTSGSLLASTGERCRECNDGVLRGSLRSEGREVRIDCCEMLETEGDAWITGGGAASSSSEMSHWDPSLATVPYVELSGGSMKEDRIIVGELATLALAERGVESPRLLLLLRGLWLLGDTLTEGAKASSEEMIEEMTAWPAGLVLTRLGEGFRPEEVVSLVPVRRKGGVRSARGWSEVADMMI